MIPDVNRGDPITADHINRVKRLASRKHVGPGIFETDDFVVHRKIVGGGGAGSTTGSLFKLVNVFDDYLECETILSDAEGTPETVLVAKQFRLRNKPPVADQNGVSYLPDGFARRHATKVFDETDPPTIVRQVEVVVPSYADVVFAEKLPADAIDVKISTGSVTDPAGGFIETFDHLEWQEVSERQWMRAADQG